MNKLVICSDYMKVKWLLQKAKDLFPDSIFSLEKSTWIYNNCIFKMVSKNEYYNNPSDYCRYSTNDIITDGIFVLQYLQLHDFV